MQYCLPSRKLHLSRQALLIISVSIITCCFLWTNIQIHEFLTFNICSCMLTYVWLSAIYFLIKQEARKHCSKLSLSSTESQSRLMANHFEGFRQRGWNSCNVTLAVIKDYSPKTTDIKQKSLQVPSNPLITRARSGGPAVSLFWPFLKDSACPKI